MWKALEGREGERERESERGGWEGGREGGRERDRESQGASELKGGRVSELGVVTCCMPVPWKQHTDVHSSDHVNRHHHSLDLEIHLQLGRPLGY